MMLSKRMASLPSPSPPSLQISNEPQLSKEDEAVTEEAEVRREDQDKINKFSRLHSRESSLEEELKTKAVRALSTLSSLLDLPMVPGTWSLIEWIR